MEKLVEENGGLIRDLQDRDATINELGQRIEVNRPVCFRVRLRGSRVKLVDLTHDNNYAHRYQTIFLPCVSIDIEISGY